MLLVDTQMKTLRRPAALSDFLQCQEGHLGDVVDALRSDWLLKVAHPSWCHATLTDAAHLQSLCCNILFCDTGIGMV